MIDPPMPGNVFFRKNEENHARSGCRGLKTKLFELRSNDFHFIFLKENKHLLGLKAPIERVFFKKMPFRHSIEQMLHYFLENGQN